MIKTHLLVDDFRSSVVYFVNWQISGCVSRDFFVEVENFCCDLFGGLPDCVFVRWVVEEWVL